MCEYDYVRYVLDRARCMVCLNGSRLADQCGQCGQECATLCCIRANILKKLTPVRGVHGYRALAAKAPEVEAQASFGLPDKGNYAFTRQRVHKALPAVACRKASLSAG